MPTGIVTRKRIVGKIEGVCGFTGMFVFIAPLNRDGIKSKGDILFEDEFDAVMAVVYSDVLKHDKEIPIINGFYFLKKLHLLQKTLININVIFVAKPANLNQNWLGIKIQTS